MCWMSPSYYSGLRKLAKDRQNYTYAGAYAPFSVADVKNRPCKLGRHDIPTLLICWSRPMQGCRKLSLDTSLRTLTCINHSVGGCIAVLAVKRPLVCAYATLHVYAYTACLPCRVICKYKSAKCRGCHQLNIHCMRMPLHLRNDLLLDNSSSLHPNL